MSCAPPPRFKACRCTCSSARQRFEEIRLAFRGTFCANLLERTLQHHARPTSVENFIWRSFVICAQVMQFLGLEFIRRDELCSASAFQAVLLHVLVCQAALQRSEEETAEAPPLPRSALERLVFQQVLEK